MADMAVGEFTPWLRLACPASPRLLGPGVARPPERAPRRVAERPGGRAMAPVEAAWVVGSSNIRNIRNIHICSIFFLWLFSFSLLHLVDCIVTVMVVLMVVIVMSRAMINWY